jgi:hypothetical protein
MSQKSRGNRECRRETLWRAPRVPAISLRNPTQENVASVSDNDPASCPKQPHSVAKRHKVEAGLVPATEASMLVSRERDRLRATERERPDLRQKYRPIGIGAVAAALTVVGNPKADNANAAANQETEYLRVESIAA